ncbi:hypothetical protein PENTCL1PPCAC_18612 [Pristionchus entomophagus]|uniref:C2H2-type domain-containing protein n=1 Tax=Pristionchus entomophagus TaxID=358040 RepID=A0AAV5TQH1_9BILA|nr:hypothetical protein PENTCL1PPCAC_18612 [Pristionchus entomophagus]
MNSLEFFAAVSTSRHRKGISYHLVSLHGNEKETKPKISSYVIPEMSKLNAFTFGEDSVRVYRYWNIGTGREEYYEDMVPNDARLLIHNSGGKLSNDDIWHKLGDPRYSEKPNQPENEEEEVETEDSKKKKRTKLESTLYRCPVETCRKEFMSEKNLEKHMTVGKHESHPEKMNVLDYTLRRFGANLEKTAPPPKVCPVKDNALESLTEESNANGRILDMGWALPKRRPSIRLPVAVKQFSKQIYDDGERTGSKTDARGAASLMRTAKNDDGGMLFIPEDLLTSRQVAGVYTGFKKTKLDKRDRTKAGGARAKTSEDEERNEVTELFNTEGDPELEWETEPLFDETDAFRVAIKKAKTALFDGDECDENGEPDPKKPKFFP